MEYPKQAELFDNPSPASSRDKDITAGKHGGVDTSVAAHRTTSDETRHRLRQRIVDAVTARKSVGMTSEELVTSTGIPLQTVSARVSELLRDGVLYDTGDRRSTKSGKTARVLKVTTEG